MNINSKKLPRKLSDALGKFINDFLGFTELNELYSARPDHEDRGLSKLFFDTMNIKLQPYGEPLNSYPSSGPLIFVSNHPYGLADGMALEHLIALHRPDTRLMSIYILRKLPEYDQRMIYVDPGKKPRNKAMNIKAWHDTYRHVSNGGTFVVFPAGSVSNYQWGENRIADSEWNPHIAAFARRTKATVVPIFVHGGNSFAYNIAGMISSRLHNIFIFKELLKLKNRNLRIHFGKQMSPDTWSHISDDKKLTAHFRAQVEALDQP